MASESIITAGTVFITLVFIVVAALFLFPSNYFIPLDRRMAGLIGSAICTLLIWIFPSGKRNNTLEDIDVQVLLVLIAIMGINFVIMRQPYVLSFIKGLQKRIRRDPNSGFWLVSFVSFIISPFIMNDGLCLLLVTPVLDAFCLEDTEPDELSESTRVSNHSPTDPFYFMLAIACSANIGSATTFSGNPQNLIIAQYLQQYMNCGLFFGILIVPAIASWLATSLLINYYRIAAAADEKRQSIQGNNDGVQHVNKHSIMASKDGAEIELSNLTEESPSGRKLLSMKDDSNDDEEAATGRDEEQRGGSSDSPVGFTMKSRKISLESPDDGNSSPLHSPLHLPELPVVKEYGSRLANSPIPVSERDDTVPHFTKDMDVALPSGSLSIIALMFFIVLIALEFVGIFSLAALFTIIAICLIGSVLLINYYRGYPKTHRNGRPYSNEERIAGISAYIEELFLDLDYNILIIFTGLFIVSGSFVHTGIPGFIWKAFAGHKPFTTPQSLILISIYVSIASQLVGNVPVVYMAQDQVSELSPKIQKMGWCVMAWVSTVAGNLTLTGSAANIIVAEKAARHKRVPVMITPVAHFKICGLITVLCIAIGVVFICLESLSF